MGEDNVGSFVFEGRCEDFTRVDKGRVEGANGNDLLVYELIAGIQI